MANVEKIIEDSMNFHSASIAQNNKKIRKANKLLVKASETAIKNIEKELKIQESGGKLDKMPRTKILINNLIDKDTIKKNYKKIEIMLKDFLKKNAEKLSTPGPSKHIVFTEKDTNKLFEIFNMDIKRVDATTDKVSNLIIDNSINEKKGGRVTQKLKSDPFNVYACALIAYFAINEKEFKDTFKYLTFYVTLRFYATVQKKGFPHEPDEQIMEYTIEHSLSNRFTIKRFNNMLELLKFVVDSQCDKKGLFYKRLITGEDRMCVIFTYNIRSRVGSFVHNVQNKFYENYEAGKRTQIESSISDDTSDEGGVYMRNIRNISNDINSASRSILLKYLGESNIDQEALKMAAISTETYIDAQGKKQKPKPRELRNSLKLSEIILELIKQNDTELIKMFIKNLIGNYLNVKGKKAEGIGTKDFAIVSFKSYQVSNTKNIYIINIKKTLDTLIEKYQDEYLKINHKSKLIKLRSVIYKYFVIFIIKNIGQ